MSVTLLYIGDILIEVNRTGIVGMGHDQVGKVLGQYPRVVRLLLYHPVITQSGKGHVTIIECHVIS